MVKGNRGSFIKKWAPLPVMGLAVVIIVLDTTLLNVSLGTIIRELNTDISSIQWVITAYSLTLAAFTITGGRLGDLFGRKKMFIIGAIVFAIGSFIASISPSVGWLIVGESVIEGFGAAMMMPATAALLVSTYRGRDRALALGVWGGMAAAGSAIGPIVGGYLASHYSWRWGFRINVFVVVILLIGSLIVKEAKSREEKPTLDIVGVFLSATGLLAGVFAIIESSHIGWFIATAPLKVGSLTLQVGSLSLVPFALAISVASLYSFYLWEKRMVESHRTPLVSMKIFSNRQFTGGAFTSAILALGQVGLIFGLPVFLQGVMGLDALHTGYALLPLSIALIIMAPLGGAISSKFTPKRIVQAGLLINVVGLLSLIATISLNVSVDDFVVPLLLYGAGMGLCFSQLSNITLSAVSPQESGEASGINSTLRQVGSSLGTAIVGSVLVVALASNLQTSIKQSPNITESNKTLIAKEVSQQASAVEFGSAVRSSVPLSESEKAEIKSISNSSTVQANKIALGVTTIFTLLAFVSVSRVPNLKNIEKNQSLTVR
ncbi:MAG: MFS transporter [Candidatus Saccharimonadales bacterium]